MEASFFTRHPFVRDVLNITLFIALVTIGTIFINTFIFRSYSVVGPSMESTLYTGDRLIVDRLTVTWAQIKGESYIPERGQVIVFKNPHYTAGGEDEYIVKRVIGLPGDRVTLKDGEFIIYNEENPGGFNPDDYNNGEPGTYTSGEIDVTVQEGEVFVSGDHRNGNYSYDSRNGMGNIPLYDIIGPVSFRIYPFTEIRSF